MQGHAANPRDHSVRNHRGNLARKQFVLPVFSPTGNDVEPFIKFVQQTRDVGRIILHIGVHRNQHLAARRMDARSHRRRLTVVSSQSDHAYARVFRGKFAQHIQASIARTIVNVDDFGRASEFLQRLVQSRLQWTKVRLFVKDRKKD